MWLAERRLEELLYRSAGDIKKQSSVHICWIITVYHIIHFAQTTAFGRWLMRDSAVSEFMRLVHNDLILQSAKQLRNRTVREINLPYELTKRYRELVHMKGRHPTTLTECGGKEDELLFSCLDVSETHYIYEDVGGFCMEKNALNSRSPVIRLKCVLSRHEGIGPNGGTFILATHHDEFREYMEEFVDENVVGGFMVDARHSLAICRIEGRLCVVDSWDGELYDLYSLPDKFVVNYLTFIYDPAETVVTAGPGPTALQSRLASD